ncbi:TetR family transcriptional regulator [Leifsonia sp. NPDC058194]|uniref:TetR family transcriptional regulator n=1 Tax=Leifsonia sp. NPDC058194 TaxID=3346374 RepID=UPI0036DD4E0D
MNNDVRERSREILRAEMANAASDFCADHGFSSVTVEDIARGIGISRATFFRYFASKEDAVVTAARLGRHSLTASIAELDIPTGTNALSVVRAALESTVVAARAEPDRVRSRIAMIRQEPALKSRLAADRAEESQALAAALEAMIADPLDARAVAVTAMAATDLAWGLWSADDRSDLGDQLDRAFALVAAVGDVAIG